MRLFKLTCFLLLAGIFFAAGTVNAQNNEGNGEPEENDEPAVEEVEATPPPAQTPPEPVRPQLGSSTPANPNILPVTFNTGVLPFLTFWQNHMIFPDSPVPWHDEVHAQLGIGNEFYRMGFARHNDIWIPVFFVRRFMMMRNSYNHILVIKGRPQSIPVTKGISIESYGTLIENEGFELFMPTFASVSRAAKAEDELESLSLATFQLEQYGFNDVVWFRDRSEDPGGVAEGWTID